VKQYFLQIAYYITTLNLLIELFFILKYFVTIIYCLKWKLLFCENLKYSFIDLQKIKKKKKKKKILGT
jgi:hypothetical protein